ncbi:hypothetical protein [Legionella saoudiensis]|uniref:hypothetical protein n=1 Tax=Legionella saoudiensis TaxID=1750561 RepID=UPI000731318D|nr:hypothetical protein [Legionella saoudiensis]
MATGFFNRVAEALRDKLTPSAPLIGGPDLNPVKPEDRRLLNKFIGDRVTHPRFSPQAMQQVDEEYEGYLPSIGLGSNAKLAMDAMDKYAASRIDDVLKLDKAQTPDGALVHELLSDKDPAKKAAIKAVKDGFNEVLGGEDVEKIQKEYKESMVAFQKLIEGPKKYHAQEAKGLLEDISNSGRNAIEAQQQKEIDDLETLFQDEDFQAHLTTALNLPEDEEENAEALAAVKESMLEDLKERHKTQLEEYNKEVQQAEITLHKAAEQQLKAFLFMADLHRNDPKMQAMIDSLARANRPDADDVVIDIGKDRTTVSCVNLDQLKFIQRLGGGEIKRKDEDGNLTYSLDMGMKFSNPRYYFNDHHKKDMLTMAQAIRASGSETITMSLTFQNQKIAEERAREAFEACLKSGFPPEKINIKVNGTLYTYEPKEEDGKKVNAAISSLYFDDKNPDKSKRARYEAAIKHGAEDKKALDDLIQKRMDKLIGPERDLASIKADLEEMKRKGREVEMGMAPLEHDADDDEEEIVVPTHSG